MLRSKALAIRLADHPAEGTSAVPNRIQILRVGNFSSDQYGKFKITAEHLLSMVKNFETKVRGYDDGRLPIDYFHENDRVAAGWIDKLALEDDGQELWADVTWTPKARQHLADGELRYVSAEFHFDYQGNESTKKFGPTLFGAGLTNRPFVKGMEPVVELTEGDSMTLEQAAAKITDLETQLKNQKTSLDEAVEKCGKYETEAKALSEAKEIADKKASEAKALSDKTAAFDKMLSDGKVCAAQKEAYLANDMVKFAECAQPVKLDAHGSSGANDTPVSATAQGEAVELSKKAMAANSKLSFGEAMQSVLLSNADLRKRVEKETSVHG